MAISFDELTSLAKALAEANADLQTASDSAQAAEIALSRAREKADLCSANFGVGVRKLIADQTPVSAGTPGPTP